MQLKWIATTWYFVICNMNFPTHIIILKMQNPPTQCFILNIYQADIHLQSILKVKIWIYLFVTQNYLNKANQPCNKLAWKINRNWAV